MGELIFNLRFRYIVSQCIYWVGEPCVPGWGSVFEVCSLYVHETSFWWALFFCRRPFPSFSSCIDCYILTLELGLFLFLLLTQASACSHIFHILEDNPWSWDELSAMKCLHGSCQVLTFNWSSGANGRSTEANGLVGLAKVQESATPISNLGFSLSQETRLL